ncbi:U5 small nuclear ribonucleoprotein 40 kDa protein [Odontomachus brunneus]|uniref:U5 small nuclear ribonucleoprotein 40 kDa protein n=1 Tax=Odontomachus brunneus TaxID=486640 RepID=UPI0013F2A3A6|nr:U5 small nuclear ribonucleoprotein 40 kDa protein [Odontomachus brunneus]
MPVLDKRKGDDILSLLPASKRTRQEVVFSSRERAILESGVNGTPRTSNLTAVVMLLEGHVGDIFSLEFHPDGQFLASTGHDRQIFLWNVYGECENIGVMTGHNGAVMELHFSPDGYYLYTASTDMTLGLWDLVSGTRVKKMKGHILFVNSVSGARRGPMMLCSGSDDCTIRVWDPRKHNECCTLNNTYQVTAVTFNDTTEQVISGGIDNDIKVWDLRKNAVLYKLKGHSDTVTGLSLSPDGSYLLSNAMDNTLKIWDVRPFAPFERCVKVLSGHQHNFEKNLLRCAWSPDGSKVSAGSADRFHYIWDTTSRRVVYKLPGHNGSVNDVDFHPKEPIVASAASDKQIYLGEID